MRRSRPQIGYLVATRRMVACIVLITAWLVRRILPCRCRHRRSHVGGRRRIISHTRGRRSPQGRFRSGSPQPLLLRQQPRRRDQRLRRDRSREFNTDFVVSERPLTTAEVATATANGRTFAYVPFAATPVAIATLDLCNPSDLQSAGSNSIHILQGHSTHRSLGGRSVYERLTSTTSTPSSIPAPLAGWADPSLTQSNGQAIPDGDGIGQASTLEPSAESFALMTYLDSDPTARAEFDNALNNPGSKATTTSDAPSERWPFQGNHSFIGGDAGLIGKELTINAQTDAPAALSSWLGLGADGGSAHDVFPVSSVWTGAPLGTPWNIPTAAIKMPVVRSWARRRLRPPSVRPMRRSTRPPTW